MLRLGSCWVFSLCSMVTGCASIWFMSFALCVITFLKTVILKSGYFAIKLQLCNYFVIIVY